MAGKVDFRIIGDTTIGLGTNYIGDSNDIAISNHNAHLNSYFNIDLQQSAYFTVLIEGFEYSRFHSSHYNANTHGRDGSEFWIPVKSMQYSQGSIENMTLAVGTFADLPLPFRKHCPSLTLQIYDARSDFFEMKLKEWHAQSAVPTGFVPVVESIVKKVTIRGFSTNGEVNYIQTCQCILADDITIDRSYEANEGKVISFKLVVIGY